MYAYNILYYLLVYTMCESCNRISPQNCLQDCPNGVTAEIKTIHGDIRTLLGKDCEVEKIMRFLRGEGCLRKYRNNWWLTKSAS